MSHSTLRTLNVLRDIPGIADRLQINIAYDHAPELTYAEAREFEANLEQRIGALLNEYLVSNVVNAFAAPGLADQEYVSVDEAVRITCRPSRKAFYHWRSRHNSRHPQHKIVMVNQCVELHSLRAALDLHYSRRTA